MTSTIALVKLMCNYENLNGFTLSSNPCECFLKEIKKCVMAKKHRCVLKQSIFK